jgi:protein SCO1
MFQRSSHAALLVMALAIACGLALSRLAPSPATASAVEWLTAPRPVADFVLHSHDGEFNTGDLRGHWNAVILGFSHCPDLCPTTLAELGALRRALPGLKLRIVFVSIDPQRDTPQVLAAYVHFFVKDMVGITGPDQQLRALAWSLGMDFRRDGPTDDPRISHSPTIALIAPDGMVHGRLRPGFDTQQAAREMAACSGTDS